MKELFSKTRILEKIKPILEKVKPVFKKSADFIIMWSKPTTWKGFFIPENPQEHPRLVRFLFLSVGVAVTVMVMVFILSFLVVRIGAPKVRIPSVNGLDIVQAAHMIQAEKLYVEIESRFDEKVPEYQVIQQHPARGLARQGRRITLVVSLGKDVYEVPQLCGLTKDEAIEQLEDQRISYEIQTVPVNNQEINTVIALSSPVGQKFARSIPLVLTVTDTIKQNQYRMEQFIRQPIEYAAVRLYNNNIKPIIMTTNVNDMNDDGIILEQSLLEGEILPKHSSLILTVGLYPKDAGEAQKLNWHILNYHFPEVAKVQDVQVMTNDGESTIVTPDAPEAKSYRIVFEDEFARPEVLFERVGAEGTTITKAFKAYGSYSISVYADGELFDRREYNAGN